MLRLFDHCAMSRTNRVILLDWKSERALKLNSEGGLAVLVLPPAVRQGKPNRGSLSWQICWQVAAAVNDRRRRFAHWMYP